MNNLVFKIEIIVDAMKVQILGCLLHQ